MGLPPSSSLLPPAVYLTGKRGRKRGTLEEGRDGRKEGKTFPSKKTREGEEKRPASLESKQSRGGPRINVAADRQNGGKKEKGKLLADVTDKKYPQTTFARLRVQKQSGIAPKKKVFFALYLNLQSVFLPLLDMTAPAFSGLLSPSCIPPIVISLSTTRGFKWRQRGGGWIQHCP